MSTSELVFVVEEAPERGCTARALGEAIFTEADDLDQLRAMVRDAVICHFDELERPRVVRLHLLGPTSPSPAELLTEPIV